MTKGARYKRYIFCVYILYIFKITFILRLNQLYIVCVFFYCLSISFWWCRTFRKLFVFEIILLYLVCFFCSFSCISVKKIIQILFHSMHVLCTPKRLFHTYSFCTPFFSVVFFFILFAIRSIVCKFDYSI